MKTTFIDTEKLADEIKAEIVRDFQEKFTGVSGTNKDLGMQALYISDSADALEVCRYIQCGDIAEAHKRLFYMDTLPRENLYSLIEEIAGEDFLNNVE